MPSVLASEDQSMHNAAAESGENAATNPDETFISLIDQRIRVLPGASDTAASFELEAEDHTLGNALRYIIMKK
ncbi:hypothetical protein HO173_000317 [Letharia columbiana]|uniref:DNA-directed RNA polymerase RBP11-like dimerisation domain-containing protein n=1 Tax=Letharia columbiana TaxID=112416 RepID=A0A8H6G6T3_9LECA|nr:uncharacterized protein HO173_000317 [Letharia columbiana]KAF6241606.1 hypothetical protein HO173_000317 [Letharia columbiana]